jgi:(E)-4-hydroxy-3-methylbut-2-enyl-diphosphate synthase
VSNVEPFRLDVGRHLAAGTGEQPAAPVFIDGKKAVTFAGSRSLPTSRNSSSTYIERRYGTGAARQTAVEEFAEQLLNPFLL